MTPETSRVAAKSQSIIKGPANLTRGAVGWWPPDVASPNLCELNMISRTSVHVGGFLRVLVGFYRGARKKSQ